MTSRLTLIAALSGAVIALSGPLAASRAETKRVV
jgi:hypothetical protein